MLTGDGRLPKYRQIMKVIRERIADRTYPPDALIPSERALAREFSTHPETANKAIATLVAEGLLYRRRGVGTFVAAGSSQDNRSTAPPAIDLLLYKHAPELFGASAFHEEIMFSLQRLITSRGYACNIVPVRDLTDFSEYLRSPRAVITSKFLPYSYLQAIASAKKPAVCLNIEFTGPGISSVGVDQRALDALCLHLYEIGHREIGFVKGPGYEFSHELRLARFRNMMGMLGLTQNDDHVYGLDPEDEASSGRLLKELKPCTAIIAADDFLAIKLKHLLSPYQVRIPEDLSLTGFGNLSITQSLYPALTTADVQREALCRLLVEEIEALLAGRSHGRALTFPSYPVFRSSTAPPRPRGS